MKKMIGERFGVKLLLLICPIALTGQNSGAQQQGSGHPPRQQRPQPSRSPKDIPAIVRAANGSIVSIVMSDKEIPIAQGSGFFVSKDGLIVTNYHLIEEGSSAVVRLPDGSSYAVDGVLSSDKAHDLAVIKAHGQNFRTLTLGNSDRVQVGEEVVAMGSPLSLESTVFIGIVSTIRADEEPGGRLLQMTAPISAGGRGGPLFNMAGEVVGITTTRLEGGENLTFAIPANDVKRLLLNRSATLSNLPNKPQEAPRSETEQEIQ
jgi:S1-C subfamily serine protease